MVRLPRALEEKRVKLLALAQRRAFESYIRYGRVPELHERAVALAVGAKKALGPGDEVSVAALPGLKATTHYTWRTAGDERVRSSHASHAGQMFSWTSPPDGGHPGAAPNCRCWAEPYYGNPDVPDALLQLVRARETDSPGREHWASIETLKRPDGSLAESVIAMRDGTQVHSTFAGMAVSSIVTPAGGQAISIEKRDGVQRTYLGSDRSLLTEVRWSANGLQMASPRVHVAQATGDPGVPFSFNIFQVPKLFPLAAMVGLYNALQVKPDSLGAGSADVPVMAFKVWTDAEGQGAGVSVEALTVEQVSQLCKRLPAVQTWTDAAATKLGPLKASMSTQSWGTAVHKSVEQTIVALKNEFPVDYQDVWPELSLDTSGNNAQYGQATSTRLDVLEDRRADLGAVCVYDIKTGDAGLSSARVKQIYELVVQKAPGAIFYIIEIRPFR